MIAHDIARGIACGIAGMVRRSTMAAVLVAAMGVSSAPLSSQTHQRPTTQKIDIAAYDFPEWCDAKIEFFTRADYLAQGIFSDTVEMRPREMLMPLRAPTIEFAKQCSGNFPIPRLTVLNGQYAPWIFLLLTANRFEDARTLTAEHIQRITEMTDDTLRSNQLIADIRVIHNIQPVRFELIRMFSDALEQSAGRGDAYQRMLALRVVMRVAIEEGDDERSTHYASRMVTLAQNLTPDEKELAKWDEKGGPTLLLAALDYLDRKVLLDSLRTNTEGYLSLRRTNAKKAFGLSVEELGFPIGKPAPVLQGAFYLPKGRTDSSAIETQGTPPYPWSKKHTVLIFLGHGCGEVSYRALQLPIPSCQPIYAALRRISERFPGVDLVIATQTHGYMWQGSPPSPAEEAALLKQWFVDFQRIPASMVVENTEHWFLPGFDKRRIDVPTDNIKNYSFEGPWSLVPSMTYLIDDQGTILHGAQLNRTTEREWNDILTAYTSRQTRGQ